MREAQRLRYSVFAEEMGAQVSGPSGLDVDPFDAYCDHLLVRDLDTLKVVGTYRVRAAAPWRACRPPVCRRRIRPVAPHAPARQDGRGGPLAHSDYRSGAVIMAVGRRAYMMQNGYETMLGCASVSMADGGHYAANLYQSLSAGSLTAPEYRAFPHTALPVDELQTGTVGAAAADQGLPASRREDLRCAGLGSRLQLRGFLTLFRLSDINARYARHFLG